MLAGLACLPCLCVSICTACLRACLLIASYQHRYRRCRYFLPPNALDYGTGATTAHSEKAFHHPRTTPSPRQFYPHAHPTISAPIDTQNRKGNTQNFIRLSQQTVFKDRNRSHALVDLPPNARSRSLLTNSHHLPPPLPSTTPVPPRVARAWLITA